MDKQFVMMDGNFRLKGRKSLEQGSRLASIEGLGGYESLWLDEADVSRFSGKAEEVRKTTYRLKITFTDIIFQVSVEPRRFHAVTDQDITSAAYPVRGVFGSGCARHDTIYQLADLNAGEK